MNVDYQDTGVEEDKHDDEPEHGLGFNGPPARASRPTVELVEGLLFLLPERVGLDDDALVADLVLSLTRQFGCNRNWNLECCFTLVYRDFVSYELKRKPLTAN